MIKKFLYSPLVILFAWICLSCDSTVAPNDKLQDTPVVKTVSVSPSEIIFVPTDGFKDTTLTIFIEAQIENTDDTVTPGYVIRDKNTLDIISIGDLEVNATSYSIDAMLETTTTSFEEYIIEVYAFNESGSGNYFQSLLSIEGFPSSPPIMIEANNPENVTIPSSGTVIVPFTAKVTDPDGQDNIDRVLIEFINEDGSPLIPSPNQLLDNGLNQDVATGDSVFTITFQIEPTNTPNNRKAIYFAVDKAGLHSDTLETVFNIVEQ